MMKSTAYNSLTDMLDGEVDILYIFPLDIADGEEIKNNDIEFCPYKEEIVAVKREGNEILPVGERSFTWGPNLTGQVNTFALFTSGFRLGITYRTEMVSFVNGSLTLHLPNPLVLVNHSDFEILT